MDKIIELTKDLAEEIKNDVRLIEFNAAQAAVEADTELQQLIGEFGLKRAAINNEMESGAEDQEKFKRLNEELKEVYDKVMANPVMTVFNEKKDAVDEMLSNINGIITTAINGEEHSCSGSCSTCGGCH